jgi:hypothetical protein
MQAFPFSSSPYVEILVGVNFGTMMSYEQTATSTGLVTCICGYQIFEFCSTTPRRSAPPKGWQILPFLPLSG